MRNSLASVGLAAALVLSVSFAAAPQAKKQSKSSGATKPFDPHDLSGIWMDDHPRPTTVMERYWIYRFTPDEPPMTAWGEAKYKAAKSSFGADAVPLAQTNDPIYRSCAPTGFPRVLLHPFPFQIVQIPGEIIVLFEWDSNRHQIFTDGRAHDTTLGPQYMGDSIGHWDGDTLVADTVNFNDKTWLDRMGHPHSDQLHIIERIRRVDRDHLTDDLTIEDPKAYIKPWTTHLTFKVHRDWTLQEQYCEDENTFEGLENQETAPPPK